jgi:hypothetical protein
MTDFVFDQRRLPSAWSTIKFHMRGPLTDARIEHYRKLGWYSAEQRQARRARRKGNYVLDGDRLIYSPL